EAGPATLGVPELDRAAVALGHRAHDREPEPASTAGGRDVAGAGAAREALEHALSQPRGDAGAAIGDLEDRRAVLLADGHRHRGALWSVDQRVLDQVQSKAVQVVTDGLDRHAHR